MTIRRPCLSFVAAFSVAQWLPACVAGPANVGVTAGEDAATGTAGVATTESLEGTGSFASSSGGADAATSSGTTTAGTSAADESTGASSTGAAIDCPDPNFTVCAEGTRGLVVVMQQAVEALRDRFEGGRTVLAAELGVPGEDSPAALAIALEAATGAGIAFEGEGSCGDSLAGAREFWSACHGRPTDAGFGCQGRCTIDPTAIELCLEEGRVSCAVQAPCGGECAGVCTLPAPAQCAGVCFGACSGACDCIFQPLGLCTGTCDGVCDGQCLFDEPTACESCVGPCLYDVAPEPEQCPADGLEGCINGGAGTCTMDCRGVPTPPVGTDACCADLVGLAGELSAMCESPLLRFGGSACGADTPKELAGLEVALGEVVVVHLRAQHYETIVAPLVAAMASPPAELDPDGCELELWNADRDALAETLADLAELRVEVDALVAAVSN